MDTIYLHVRHRKDYIPDTSENRKVLPKNLLLIDVVEINRTYQL